MDRPMPSGPQQGGPPQGAPPEGRGAAKPPSNPVENNRSALNPTDLAAMGQMGTASADMKVGDFIQNVLKVPLDAPLPALLQALRKQGENASPLGKVRNMGGGPQGQPPSQPPSPRGGAGPGGLDSLMS